VTREVNTTYFNISVWVKVYDFIFMKIEIKYDLYLLYQNNFLLNNDYKLF